MEIREVGTLRENFILKVIQKLLVFSIDPVGSCVQTAQLANVL